MKVAALQMDVVWEDRQANYRKVREYAAAARSEGAELLVLPEMFATGFSMNPQFTAEPSEGPTYDFLRNLAAKYEIAVVGGFVQEAGDAKGENVAVAFDDKGELLARYAKTHLFLHAGEGEHHLPGAGPVTFSLGANRCAVHICYDLRFPELFRLTSAQCDFHIVIASWPAARQRHWDMLLPARAIENQLYVLGVNRVGSGGGLDYTGGTVLYDPLGDCVAFAAAEEQLLFGDVNAAEVALAREAFPALNDRRF